MKADTARSAKEIRCDCLSPTISRHWSVPCHEQLLDALGCQAATQADADHPACISCPASSANPTTSTPSAKGYPVSDGVTTTMRSGWRSARA